MLFNAGECELEYPLRLDVGLLKDHRLALNILSHLLRFNASY